MIKMLPYLLVLLFNFYFLPTLIQDTGSAIFFLLLIIPLICFLCSLVYGIFQGISLYYPLIVAGLFVPSIFIYYNTSAWVYLVVYGILAFIGESLGVHFFKGKKRLK